MLLDHRSQSYAPRGVKVDCVGAVETGAIYKETRSRAKDATNYKGLTALDEGPFEKGARLVHVQIFAVREGPAVEHEHNFLCHAPVAL